jgi:hypothetical protein
MQLPSQQCLAIRKSLEQIAVASDGGSRNRRRQTRGGSFRGVMAKLELGEGLDVRLATRAPAWRSRPRQEDLRMYGDTFLSPDATECADVFGTS